MKLKIKNPKLVAFLLTNSIIMTTVGCTHTENEREFETISKFAEEKDENAKPINVPKAKIKKVNRNIYLKEGKLAIKEAPRRNSETIKKMGVYQKAREIKRLNNGWSLVKYDGVKGYIKTAKVKAKCSNLGKTYVEIDISDQKMRYYENDKKVLSTDVVTGSQEKPTHIGLYNVYQKCPNYTMHGLNNAYEVTVSYAIKYNQTDLEYIHDASWRSEFGGTIYKEDGSHGCINTPYQKTKTLYNKVALQTPVLVHK